MRVACRTPVLVTGLLASAAFVVALVAVVPASEGGEVRTAAAEPAAFEPGLLARIERAQAYATGRPGFTGIVVRDRQTGAVWRNDHAATPVWACSTPKLAMVVDLLLRNDAHTITLTDQDRGQMHAMLHTSDDASAHALWNRYGGEDFATRFPGYGMTDMRFTPDHPHHWGWILTTPDDLDRLINYVLTRLPAQHRDYLVREMRSVGANQQWGVWGSGPTALPGTKNGWSDDNADGSWLVNSVGFVGPDARYTVAMMNNTQVVQGGEAVGRETTTRVSRELFGGYFR